ncbi:MAG: RecX family transcriptional regulator [Bacteroidota bacterium]
MSFRPRSRPDAADEPERPPLTAGTVTRLVQQQKNTDRVSVFLDGAFAFGLTKDLAVTEGLRKGRALTVAEQEALLVRDEGLRARRKALDVLSYKARTSSELRRKLRDTGFGEPAIEAALARMEELGYLDDAAYAHAYAKGRFAGRGYGPQRIRSDLMKRGLDRRHIDAALADLAEPDDLVETALRHGRKRWDRLASESDPRKRTKKTYDFLLRRGYGFDTARRVVETLQQEDEDRDA